MATNNQVNSKVIYPELSYKITGVLFSVHNEIGQYAKEKHCADLLETKLKELNIPYKREVRISNGDNIPDFIIDNKIILELKTVRIITKDNYSQIQNYLQQTKIKLGILVNFRNKYIKPIRIIRIDSHN